MDDKYNIYYVQVKNKLDDIAKERLESMGDCIEVFDTTYLIYTEENEKYIYERLSKDNELSIFIGQLRGSNYYGRANKRVWEWIQNKRKR